MFNGKKSIKNVCPLFQTNTATVIESHERKDGQPYRRHVIVIVKTFINIQSFSQRKIAQSSHLTVVMLYMVSFFSHNSECDLFWTIH